MVTDRAPDGSVITIVITKEKLFEQLPRPHIVNLYENAACVAYSTAEDTHIVDKDRHGEWGPPRDDADLLATLIMNITGALPKE